MRNIIIILSIFIIASCGTTSNSRYAMRHDKAPTRLPTADEIIDITPMYEPYSRGGNKDYTVRGISYQVMKSAVGYTQEGNASWYGSKFHGHLTSNGEIYNMYTLSAAHKNLPLPSFVKVTNLNNGQTITVRVNDRGPFHHDRIIDLSYGAAHRLDMLKSGTTRVSIEVLTFPDNRSPLSSPVIAIETKRSCLVQLAAISNKINAREKINQLTVIHQVSGQLEQAGQLYRMQLGPLGNYQQCQALLNKVMLNYPKAFIKTI